MFFLLHAAVLMDSVATALSKESASGHSGVIYCFLRNRCNLDMLASGHLCVISEI